MVLTIKQRKETALELIGTKNNLWITKSFSISKGETQFCSIISKWLGQLAN